MLNNIDRNFWLLLMIWIYLSCEKAIQLAYGTSLVLLRCSLVPYARRDTLDLPPPVKAVPVYDLNSANIVVKVELY